MGRAEACGQGRASGYHRRELVRVDGGPRRMPLLRGSSRAAGREPRSGRNSHAPEGRGRASPGGVKDRHIQESTKRYNEITP